MSRLKVDIGLARWLGSPFEQLFATKTVKAFKMYCIHLYASKWMFYEANLIIKINIACTHSVRSPKKTVSSKLWQKSRIKFCLVLDWTTEFPRWSPWETSLLCLSWFHCIPSKKACSMNSSMPCWPSRLSGDEIRFRIKSFASSDTSSQSSGKRRLF